MRRPRQNWQRNNRERNLRACITRRLARLGRQPAADRHLRRRHCHLLVWSCVRQADEVTRGMGKVIPTSKAQLVQAAAPATVTRNPGPARPAGQARATCWCDSTIPSPRRRSASWRRRTSGWRRGRCGSERRNRCRPGAARRAPPVPRNGNWRSCAAPRPRAGRTRFRPRSNSAGAICQEGQATVASLENSARLAQEQVNMLAPLAAKGIVPQTELLTAQRELVDVQGRLAAARQGIGRAAAAISEAQAQLSQAQFDFRQQALNERSEVATKIAVNTETIKGASARLERNELRAPVDRLRQRCQGHHGRGLRQRRRAADADRADRRKAAGRGPGRAEGHRLHQGRRPGKR